MHNHRRLDACASCNRRLKRAAELYTGEFLAGLSLPDSTEFDEWLLVQREALHQHARTILAHCATYAEARGDFPKALDYGRRQLEFEPWNEEAHRHVMFLLWVTGQRSAALLQYKACSRVLDEELGIEPSEPTCELYTRILRDDSVARQAEAERVAAIALHNLPPSLTPFVGRDSELAHIAEQLEKGDRRLITLVGPGGVGKSRLALTAATAQLGAFRDGIYFVPLAPLLSSDLAVSAIAQAISLRFSGKEDEEAQLLRHLSNKEMLLVIDNFEHLLDGARLLNQIVEAAPSIYLLATSRERLNLRAEFIFDVGGLSYPPERVDMGGDGLIGVDEACGYAAVRLFLARAQARSEQFRLTESNAPAVAQICRIVAGLPLAIELAAAQVPDFSCAEIASAIRSNLDFLATELRDVPAAHSSIRAVFNYSWSLLTDEERGVLRRLSVFLGGWDAEAALEVALASRRLLGVLAGKSLIKVARRDAADSTGAEAGGSAHAGGVRYSIHEVLRQYVAEELDLVPQEKACTQERHALYFRALAEQAEPHLMGKEQEVWLQRLEAEHDNLRAALRWAREGAGEPTEAAKAEIGLRTAGAIWRFWFVKSYFSEGREQLRGLLALGAAPIPTAGDESGATCEARGAESRELSAGRAKALNGAGVLACQQGDYEVARTVLYESLALQRALGDKRGMGISLNNLGIVAQQEGDYMAARAFHEESLVLKRELGNKAGMGISLNNLGIVAQQQGDYEAAHTLHEESLALKRELGDKGGIAMSLTNLGIVVGEQGDYRTARQLLEESLTIKRELGNKSGIAISLAGLGGVAVGMGRTEQGTRVLAAVEVLLESMSKVLSPEDRLPYERAVATARERLGEDAFSRAWGEGLKMSMEQAISAALEDFSQD